MTQICTHTLGCCCQEIRDNRAIVSPEGAIDSSERIGELLHDAPSKPLARERLRFRKVEGVRSKQRNDKTAWLGLTDPNSIYKGADAFVLPTSVVSSGWSRRL